MSVPCHPPGFHAEFARHIGYTPSGLVKMVRLPQLFCLPLTITEPPSGQATNLVGRMVTYGPSTQLPQLAVPFICCKAVNPCPRVLTDCFGGSGVPTSFKGFLNNNLNCDSANKVEFNLNYCCASGSGCIPATPGCPIPTCGAPFHCTTPSATLPDADRWTGSASLRGGSLTFELYLTGPCDVDHPQPSATLYWHGCEESCVGMAGTFLCDDPVIISFPGITLGTCCDCVTDHTSNNPHAAIDLTIVGACHAVALGRHVGYDPSGRPKLATANPCNWNVTRVTGCAMAYCALHLSISAPSGDPCSCMAGASDFPIIDSDPPHWETGYTGCHSPVQITMDCLNHTDDCGNIVSTTLFLNVVCGADTTGSASVTILPEQMDNLDVTFTVGLVRGGVACTGVCNFRWNEMAVVWEQAGDTCTTSCDPCPNAPTNPPADPVDGQLYSEPCPVPPGECCTGTILVRVTR